MYKDKIVTETPKFNLIERENKMGIVSTVETVMLLPFISDDKGLPLMIGVLRERNFFREGGYAQSLITGTCEDNDDYLKTAKRELKEESGYDVDDNDKWYFLGTVTGNKFVDKEYSCFGIDVTGIEPSKPITDGSEQEEASKFHFIAANDVVKAKDVFIPALFLKLFKFVVGMDLYNRDDSTFGKEKGFTGEI
jgi:8-oxo-dGTP pyrophosphatase MutT (NUDIX family)